MFTMLAGALPVLPVTADGSAPDRDDVLRAALALQVAAGVGLLVDGGGPASVVGLAARWRRTAAAARALDPAAVVAQVVEGPYTAARRARGAEGPGPGARARRAATLRAAEALAAELVALAQAGCPVVVVEEPAAVRIGEDAGERRLFADAGRRLLAEVGDDARLHAMLSILGGSAAAAGPAAIFAAPYRSHRFDLVAGPDDWRLVRAAPPERGIVCAALDLATPRGDRVPLLVWAAHYAASAGGRGLARVGLANASCLDGLGEAAVRDVLADLVRAASLAVLPLDAALASGLEPRAVGSRAAALGPDAPAPRRRVGRRTGR